MTNYAKLDHSHKRIIMDRTFAKNAEIIGSDEYEKLMECRREFPNYTVVRRTIKKNVKQEHYCGLTYKYMEEYIMRYESRETVSLVLNEFYDKLFDAEGHSKAVRYPTIKRWFLNKYPDFASFGATSHEEEVEAVEICEIPSLEEMASEMTKKVA